MGKQHSAQRVTPFVQPATTAAPSNLGNFEPLVGISIADIKYEYHYQFVSMSYFTEFLCIKGKDGWRFRSHQVGTDGGMIDGFHVVLERPVK